MVLSLAFVMITATRSVPGAYSNSFRRLIEWRVYLVRAWANNSRIIDKSCHFAILINFLNWVPKRQLSIYNGSQETRGNARHWQHVWLWSQIVQGRSKNRRWDLLSITFKICCVSFIVAWTWNYFIWFEFSFVICQTCVGLGSLV